MVTRHGFQTNGQPQSSLTTDTNPPYPVTPTSDHAELNQPSKSKSNDTAQPQTSSNKFDNLLDDDDLPDWDDSSDDEDKADTSQLPAGLRAGGGHSAPKEPPNDQGLPTSLRIGSPSPLNVSKTGESSKPNGELYQNVWANSTGSSTAATIPPTSPTHKSNNPFLKNRSPQSPSPVESSPWNDTTAPTSGAPFQLPLRTSTQEATATTDPVNGRTSSPFSSQPPLIPYDSEFPSNQSQNHPPVPEVTISSPSSGKSQPFYAKYGSIKSSNPFADMKDESDVSLVPGGSQNEPPTTTPQIPPVPPAPTVSPPQPPPPAPVTQSQPPDLFEQPLPKPSRPLEEQPPPQPPRPQDPNALMATTSSAQQQIQESPQEQVKKQSNETYQIKHIRWRDISCHDNPRQSPILVQNANGPCPLLALVNALVLSTPADLNTALIETLRSREQVSLGLLLDAVFDELMSGRRGGTAQALPDVGELYSFLITLHTGMNVNPRFIPAKQEIPNLIDFDDSVPASVLPPLSKHIGSFERTKELQLYGTFAVPLIHGWLPEPNTSAYEAFRNAAPTYEEAQNILFRQEEIEQKLGSQDLTYDEERMLIDIDSINQFFATWPTQLTKYGLEAIQAGVGEGDIAILFRNDHFSTVYKEPRSGALMTLMTDAGYSSHEEIVWESLVDISGTSTEFFAGDFKSVSHDHNAHLPTSSNARPNRNSTSPPTSSHNRRGTFENFDVTAFQDPTSDLAHSSGADPSNVASGADANSNKLTPVRSAAEQEDHDLALALQLQEEEEERHRSDRIAARRREEELSQQFLSQDSSRPEIPPRRSQQQTAPRTNRPDSLGPNAPPPYEQAAQGRPFHPPRNHPSSEHAPRRYGSGQTGGTYAGVAGSNAQPSGGGRRRTARQSLVDQIPAGSGQQQGRYKDERDGDKCSVM